jgi:hypothetical protein
MLSRKEVAVVAGIKECPRCETISSVETRVCDCGYSFNPDRDKDVYWETTTKHMRRGILLLALAAPVLALLIAAGIPENGGAGILIRIVCITGFGGIVSLLVALKRSIKSR